MLNLILIAYTINPYPPIPITHKSDTKPIYGAYRVNYSNNNNTGAIPAHNTKTQINLKNLISYVNCDPNLNLTIVKLPAKKI